MTGDGLQRGPIAGVGDIAAPVSGPAADYPVVVGEPYVVNGIEYAPSDSMNVDQVGYAATDIGARGYSAAHHTLPLPSYAEVTSLETGRTVLVRVERRGPMGTNDVIGLAPGALAQLGAGEGHPVRVRRVNPPEDQRALLRDGAAAPLRMDTPASLLTVLQRRLPERGAASLAARRSAVPQSGDVEVAGFASPTETVAEAELPAAAQGHPNVAQFAEDFAEPVEAAEDADSEVAPVTLAEAAPVAQAEPTPTPTADGRFVVQAAAFASEDNARRAAAALDGTITQSGRFYRVRTGPYATRGEAEASLANVRRAGYSDARILTSG
ncbi:hypothetical protein AAW00_03805 [Aurantiacibacter luteus]|uniref:SPOR domain-containing protein n=1 Tax=Aurantiacibacter luteus TaxID=1581420 RepID=A0A0G9N3G8_9SPHN|nr:hypothetical protein AAW00_03805 [Aurantiacibacter luteus]